MPYGKRRKGRIARACVALLTSLALIGAVAGSAQALPAKFWGVDPQAMPNEEQMQRLARGGVESIRVPFAWGSLQPERRGGFEWAVTDPVIADAAKAGIDVLGFFTGAPSWAVREVFVPGSGASVKAPVHLPVRGAAASGWRSLLRQAILRYGPRGSFWAEHPELPRRPIRNWQIWNEPNFKYFVTKPNPAEYGRLVKISYSAIRAADPGARTILAGLFSRPKNGRAKERPKRQYYASDFLEMMYDKTPGVAAKFDAVALHPYTRAYRLLTPYVEEVRTVMKQHADAGKALWITELGWSSQSPNPGNQFAKGPAGQVNQLKGAFRLLIRNHVKWRLKRTYWFSVDDLPGTCNFCDGTGLFGPGFKPKRSWYQFVRFAGGTP